MVTTWILSAGRAGDLRQMQLVAEALHWPSEVVQVRFQPVSPWKIALWPDRYLAGDAGSPFAAREHPKLVLCAEASACALAAHAKRAGGRFKLVCIGRPRGRWQDFDAIVTSAQYPLPDLPNVTEIPVAPHRLPAAGELPAALKALARPLSVVLVGGESRPDRLDVPAAQKVGARVNQEATMAGSVVVLTSPRTGAAASAALQAALDPKVVFLDWREKPNPYAALLHAADRFLVTSDSVSMTVEALMSGKPVYHIPLPQRPGLGDRLTSALWRAWPTSPLFSSGLIEARPDRMPFYRELSEKFRLNQDSGQDVPDTAAAVAGLIRQHFSRN